MVLFLTPVRYFGTSALILVKGPNYFTHPSLLTLAKDTSGNVINVTEKPPELAAFLLGMFCKPGATVLIVGTGAGGCVKGAVKAGLNVVGVENDEKQFNSLFSELNGWVASLAQRRKKMPNPSFRNQRMPMIPFLARKTTKKMLVLSPTFQWLLLLQYQVNASHAKN